MAKNAVEKTRELSKAWKTQWFGNLGLKREDRNNETCEKHMGKRLGQNATKTHVNKTIGASNIFNIVAYGSKSIRFPTMKYTFMERVGKRGEAGTSISS